MEVLIIASQNLISASIAPDTKADILKKLADIKGNLSFLLTLQPGEKQALFKAGNSYAPFIEKAFSAMNTHPQIMAGVFDTEEFIQGVATPCSEREYHSWESAPSL